MQRTPVVAQTPIPSPETVLDQYVMRLQNLEPFNIHSLDQEGEPVPWYEVLGPQTVQDLVIRESDLAIAVQTVSAQIAHWARLSAQALRIVHINQRKYAVWKAKKSLEIIQKAKDEGEKKPTKDEVEKTYRLDPEYAEVNVAIERAEEAYNAAEGYVDAFKAKKQMLERFVWRARDGIGPQFVVP